MSAPPKSNPQMPTRFEERPAREWLAALFEGVPGVVEVRALDARTGRAREDLRAFASSPEEALAAIARAARAGVNVYAAVATRRDASSGKKENVAAVRAVYADLDAKAGADLAALLKRAEAFPLPPSLTVASGGGVHLYWLLEEPLDLTNAKTLESFEATLRGVAAVLDADPSVAEAARVLRPPGTLNLPNAEKRAKGRTVAPVRLLKGSGALYSLEDFDAFELRGRSVSPEAKSANAGGEKVEAGGRHPFLLSLAATLRRRGLEEAALVEALRAVNHAQCEPPLGDKEVEGMARWAGSKEGGRPYTGEEESAGEEWSPPLPLENVEVPPFPTDALPTWLGDFVRAEAEALQVPADLPGVLALAAVAASIGGKVRVLVSAGYSEPTNLYVAVAQEPGALKSAAFADATRPLRDSEKALGEKVERERDYALAEHARLQAELEAAKKAKQWEAVKERLRDVREAEKAIPVPPTLVCDDVTPEALALVLAENGERVGLFSAEGGELFELMRGRYSSNARANLGVYLKAHAGDSHAVDRKGVDKKSRQRLFLERPALTVGLAVQPAVIRGLRDTSEFRERGLLGRFLYAVPRGRVGARDWRAKRATPENVAEEYARRLRSLAELFARGIEVPLTEEAAELLLALREELEPKLAPEGGELAFMAEWAGKLAGAVARIAGVLHAARFADRARYLAELPIDADTMRAALALGRYFLEHARAVFVELDADPALRGAVRAWRFVRGWHARNPGAQSISRREVWEGVKGGLFRSVDDLEPALALLERREYLALAKRPDGEKKRGRAAGPSYRVNPLALALRE